MDSCFAGTISPSVVNLTCRMLQMIFVRSIPHQHGGIDTYSGTYWLCFLQNDSCASSLYLIVHMIPTRIKLISFNENMDSEQVLTHIYSCLVNIYANYNIAYIDI